jgi:hypothetical protein
MWGELTWFMWSDFVLKWSEVSYGKVLVDKVAMYIRVTLYSGHLIILWLFHFGYILHCDCFNLYCGGFILFCNVCVCVCVWVCVCGVCNVWVFWYCVYCNLTEVFLTLTEVFLCFFLSCKANARVKLANTRHGPHSSRLVICVLLLQFVSFSVLFVCKCVLYYCHGVSTQLQSTNIHIINITTFIHSFIVSGGGGGTTALIIRCFVKYRYREWKILHTLK